MLEHIAYLGHELTGVTFKLLDKEPQGDGFYNYSVKTTPDISITSTESGDSPIQTIRMSIVSSINGFSGKQTQDGEDEPESVFSLEIEFDLLFELEGEMPCQEFLESNQWYFLNYAHVASKEISNDITDNSVLKGTYLPSHRIGQRD
ncbi:TPA: hypothetical protein NJ225_003569 [Vibrio parahaemolyticus]|uniref:hypothetical protein n=1 Tax=Vibrio parahaemolyticus TaxID=670 RepID=UPI001123C967|nr:hypothetical protein [Vibrio parahaemolyticus]MBE3759992.1 hypothetical protein [Vibrio parahaemolyticus]TOI26461.1 hypothetical protein CGI64_18250 [Vibrio parahaemolyticus]HCG6617010.1 hypothetical protein [Vibrio parahaemolyticus]